MATNTKRELWITHACIAATLITFSGLFHFLYVRAHTEFAGHHMRALLRTVAFAGAMFFLAYGNLLYQICLMGYYKRKAKHRPASRAAIESLYASAAPSLTVLIPSYKEEYNVVWQTMVSAALAEYPQKDVVLLIDDPIRPKAIEDQMALAATRQIPTSLQTRFDVPLARFRSELESFMARAEAGKVHAGVELNRLSILYEEVADWLDKLAQDFVAGREFEKLSHIDRFFVSNIIQSPANAHRERAKELRHQLGAESMSLEEIKLQYQRLSSLFQVNFSSFERKKYANLSHEANKAMNLNSYISLMGKSWKEVESRHGLILQECGRYEADFTIAAPELVNTIDADTQMVSDYALRLVQILQQPGNENIAVIQSPCSTFPGSPSTLERTAKCFVDMQFQTHQGLTHWNASFWVGANAMLRFAALNDIRETREEKGHIVSLYIQDRTVIEDTESTVDLVDKGWRLYNYPDRLTYSPTPPDFGSLLIQRRRWANGHLIILPKLLRYTWRAPKSLTLLKEFFLRFHYLVSSISGCMMILLFCCCTFGLDASSPWLPFTNLPFLYLYIRDLKNVGYKRRDFFRVYALNLMLIPIIAGGVLKSLQQIVTGQKTPFGRTPKVPGRTAAPALYSIIEVALPCICLTYALIDAANHHWSRAFGAMINSIAFFYVLVRFMGVKETMQDIAVGMIATRQAFAKRSEEMLGSIVRGIPLFAGKLQRG